MNRAFTLLESLVTVGTLVVLASLLIPLVGGVRESGRSMECAVRLHQYAVAAIAYSGTYRGVFPAAVLHEQTASGVRTIAWDFTHGAGALQPGPLSLYTDRPFAMRQCPCCEAPTATDDAPNTGFNYNTSFIGAEGAYPSVGADGVLRSGWQNARLGVPASAHHRPSQTALFGDGGWSGGTNKFMRAPEAMVEMDLGVVYAGAQAFRHQGCTNIAWLDGHTSSICAPCEGEHALAAYGASLLTQPLGWPRNGFLSQNNASYDPR
jgi:prepilin-type processing-associated H-X9-DG protein